MKEKILSVALLITVIVFVTVNTLILNKQIGDITENVSLLTLDNESAEENAERIYADFMKKEKYMSITVSHDDLTSIEDCFVEMIGFISVGDIPNAEVTRSRLISYLEHLRRLSGFNIDAVI